jgi:uncharacterized protein (TIGR02391 family)
MLSLSDDPLLQTIQELHLAAFRLRDEYLSDTPDLLESLQQYEKLVEELQRQLPAAVLGTSSFVRHTKWTSIRIRQRNLRDCYEDIRDLCYSDIPRLQKAYLSHWQAMAPERNWYSIHETVRRVAESRFETGHYADAVEAAFKEINKIVKHAYKQLSGKEKDGDALMREAFTCTPNNNHTPHLRLTDLDLTSDSGRNVQQGYMDLFAGAMRGIRNPKAHDNITIDAAEGWEMVVFGSHLMRMWDRGHQSAPQSP